MSDSVTLWTVACQAPPSMAFSRQEYWSRLAFPSPGDLPDPGIEPKSPASPAVAGGFFTTMPPGNHSFIHSFMHKSSGTYHMSGAAEEVGVSFPVGDLYPACLEGVGDEKGRKRVGLGTSIRGRY